MPAASQIGDLTRKAISSGFQIGTSDFNRFVGSGGRTAGLPTVGSSGFGVGKTFIGGNPIDAYGKDRFGRPLASAKARDVLNTQATEANRFDPELLQVTKSDPINAAFTKALEQSRADADARRTQLNDFNQTADLFRKESQAEIDRNAKETFNTDRLRDFLSDENRRFETSSQDVARRASQFLRRRLDEQMLAGAGAGAPIGDSSDLRNRTMQSFIDINLPLQQQLSDRRIQQEQYLKGLDINTAGQSQAARAALLSQLTVPLQLGQQLEGNDLMNLARLQAIDEANNFRGVQADVPNDFTGLGSYGISTPYVQSGRITSPQVNGGFQFDAYNPNQAQARVVSPSASIVNNASRVDSNGFPIEWGFDNAQPAGRRVMTPTETMLSRRATRQVSPDYGSVTSRIGSTGIVNGGNGYFSVPTQ